MADNITITPGQGANVATDEVLVEGVLAHVQRTKIMHGLPGAATDASSQNPLPAQIGDGTNQAVVKAANTAPATGDPALVVAISPNSPAQLVTGTVGISGTVPVSGTMGISGTVPVTGTELGQIKANLDTIIADTSTVPVAPNGNAIYAGTTALTPKFIPIAGTGSADLIALVASKKLRVLSYTLMFNAATTAKFQTGAATDLTGAMPFGDKGGMHAAFCQVGHFETVAGAKLNLVLGTSVAWAGHITYIEV